MFNGRPAVLPRAPARMPRAGSRKRARCSHEHIQPLPATIRGDSAGRIFPAGISELCKTDRSAYATAAERMLMAIGSPELLDTGRPTAVADLLQQGDPPLSGFADFHGMEECIDQIVSYFTPCRPGPGGEEADPLPAGPGGRRQVLAGREAQTADGTHPLLCHHRARRCSSRRSACSTPTRTAPNSKRNTVSPALPDRSCRPGRPSASTSSAATSAKFRVVVAPPILNQIAIAKTEPGDETTRTSPHWSARWISASWRNTRRTTPMPTATRALVPGQPGPDGVRRDVQRHRSRCCTRC